MKLLKILPLAILIFIFSCNEINNPIKETNNTCGDESLPTPIRKILTEDYTGQRCSNCPDAADILQGIKDDYCDHIVPIAVHVSFFAAPDNDFPADYRTETGNELNEYFLVSNQGLPNGLINRSEFDGNIVIGRNNQRAAVDAVYNILPGVNIIIESSYNNVTKKITATVTTEFLTSIDYDLNLGLYITEDSIISPQKDGSEIIEDYVHRHMLRKGVNGAFGEKIASSGEFGDIIEKTFIIDADTEWVIEHCELVAFICNSSTNEVIQAESEHIHLD